MDAPPLAPVWRLAPPVSPPPPPPVPRRWRAAGAGVAVLSLVVGGGAGWVAAELGADPAPAAAATVTPAALALDGEALDVAGVLARVEPSVVSIETTVVQRRGRFAAEGQGAGTGIVLDAGGEILTNAHVVDGASSITVTVPGDDRPRAAELVASDPSRDLALLRVADTDGLVAAPLGSSADVAVGDDVVAIGNALALEGGLTVTSGIVSALDRSIETEAGTLEGLLQTDAAISSGNSGGPLVNSAGEVIGINTAVATSGGGVSASNIGFVIPVDTARTVAAAMLAR